MKEQLRSCVDGIARHKFDANSHEDLLPACSKIYACMLDEMHTWLKQATGQPGVGHTLTGSQITQLLALASECEVVGNLQRAMQIHEERFASRFIWICVGGIQ